MGKSAKLIMVGTKRYLITDETDWLEGRAFDTIKEEAIYYNGDYGDIRPNHIKKLLAENSEVGWVKHPSEDSSFVARFDSVASMVLPMLYIANGHCIVEDEKIEGQFVIKLLL